MHEIVTTQCQNVNFVYYFMQQNNMWTLELVVYFAVLVEQPILQLLRRQELQHNLLQSFRTTSCQGATDNTHTVGMSVANAAVRETCSSICPSQWGSVGLSRLANQSLSPPVLLRSSRLHRAGCRAQSTMPTNAVSAEPLQKKEGKKKTCAHSLWTRERSKEFKTTRENTVWSVFELLLILL